MPPGGHRGGSAKGGEELDNAQKLVKKFLASTMSNSRRARASRENQVVERSLIGQQPSLAQADIRPYLWRPYGQGNNQTVPNGNPFGSPAGTSTGRQPAPRRDGNDTGTNIPGQDQHGTFRAEPGIEVLGNNADNAIPIEGVIDDATQNHAANVRQQNRTAQRAQVNRQPQNAAARRIFLTDQLIQNCSSYMAPLADAIQ